jgi:hypothetical protein
MEKARKKWNTLIIALSISLVRFHCYTAGSDFIRSASAHPHLGRCFRLCFYAQTGAKNRRFDRVLSMTSFGHLSSCAPSLSFNYDAGLWKTVEPWHGFPIRTWPSLVCDL